MSLQEIHEALLMLDADPPVDTLRGLLEKLAEQACHLELQVRSQRRRIEYLETKVGGAQIRDLAERLRQGEESSS